MARIQSCFVGVASMTLEPPRLVGAVPGGRNFMVQTLNLRMEDGSLAEIVLHFEEGSRHLVLNVPLPPADGHTWRPVGPTIESLITDGLIPPNATIGHTLRGAHVMIDIDVPAPPRRCSERLNALPCWSNNKLPHPLYCSYCGEAMP